VTLSAPDDDHVSYTVDDLLAKLRVAVGGRVAEELVYATVTTGAESDIQQLTAIARQMVGRWGMSEAVGLVSVLPLDARGPLLPGVSETSQATQQLVDDEVRRLIDDAHQSVTDLLGGHRAQLKALAEALLRSETLDGIDAYRAAGLPLHASDSGTADSAAAA
jgi:cell division protease FtsH